MHQNRTWDLTFDVCILHKSTPCMYSHSESLTHALQLTRSQPTSALSSSTLRVVLGSLLMGTSAFMALYISVRQFMPCKCKCK
jgi:hypothetical protein